MQLINALVTSPDDLDLRLHIRNEFIRCGLKNILPVSATPVTLAMLKLLPNLNTLSPCTVLTAFVCVCVCFF